MTGASVAPFGTWTSPITPQDVAAAALRLGSVVVDGDDIYWIEGRPAEGGRSVIVSRDGRGRIADVTPQGTDVRTRVHECRRRRVHAVSRGNVDYSEFADQRIYRLGPQGQPEPLTPAGDWYFADWSVDVFRERLVAVREDHTVRGREAMTTLVSVPFAGEPTSGTVVVSGHDFYATPRFSPDGSQLSWLAWRHPQMPWDGTELWVAEVAADGSLERPTLVAGGDSESIFQPGWSPGGELHFVSDRTGWWNLYRWRSNRIEAVHTMAAEFGRPLWQLGTATWAFVDRTRLLAACGEGGRWSLVVIDTSTGSLTPVPTDLEPTDTIAAARGHGVLVAGSSSAPDAVIRVDPETGAVETIRAASEVTVLRPACPVRCRSNSRLILDCMRMRSITGHGTRASTEPLANDLLCWSSVTAGRRPPRTPA